MSEHHLASFFEPFELIDAPYSGRSAQLSHQPIARTHHRAFDVVFEGDKTAGDVPLIAKTGFANDVHPTGIDRHDDPDGFDVAEQLFFRERIALSMLHAELSAGRDVGWLVRPAEKPTTRDRFFVLERYGPSLNWVRIQVKEGGVAAGGASTHLLLARAMVCGVRSLQALAGLNLVHRDLHADNFRLELTDHDPSRTVTDASYVCTIDLDHARSGMITTQTQPGGVKAILGHPGFQSPQIWAAYCDKIAVDEITVTFDLATDLFGLAVSLCFALGTDGPWAATDPLGVTTHPDPYRVWTDRGLARAHDADDHVCAYDRAVTCAFGTAYELGLVRFDPTHVISQLEPLGLSDAGRTIRTFIELIFTVADIATGEEAATSALDASLELAGELERELGLDPADRPAMGTYPLAQPRGAVEVADGHFGRSFVGNPFTGPGRTSDGQRARLQRVYEQQHADRSMVVIETADPVAHTDDDVHEVAAGPAPQDSAGTTVPALPARPKTAIHRPVARAIVLLLVVWFVMVLVGGGIALVRHWTDGSKTAAASPTTPPPTPSAVPTSKQPAPVAKVSDSDLFPGIPRDAEVVGTVTAPIYCFCDGPRGQISPKFKVKVSAATTNPKPVTLRLNKGGSDKLGAYLVVSSNSTFNELSPPPSTSLKVISWKHGGTNYLAIPAVPDGIVEQIDKTSQTWITHWRSRKLSPGGSWTDKAPFRSDLVFYVPATKSADADNGFEGFIWFVGDGKALAAQVSKKYKDPVLGKQMLPNSF